uniref:broad substrate specificity ATP-binding cassette transporter ABCG2-like n=1 Tax=Styela clava TaxID=7725 RepID=UPI001939D155|nr:broad substrate specificity ATP-binding cassette transporter ABCG2-like [Styela clava]
MSEIISVPEEPSNGSDVVIENISVVSSAPRNEDKTQIQGSVMSFHHIKYTVDLRKSCCGPCRDVEKKAILDDVSGIMRPGLNAIMGSTGSGKSSLLDVLANRKDPAWCEGNVLIDGQPIPRNFRNYSGYVTQNDLMVATISVRESLWFSANLRMPTTVSRVEKEEKIEKIIEDLGLSSCADTKIGNDIIRGISGGEKKRTSIALELILEPKILFLDEPTTGLDAATAWSVMMLLKKLGRQGHTIVCSIHQPRYSIYKLLDTLTLLSKGNLVYHGPNEDALAFFESLGYICEMHDNPADFFLDVLNGHHAKSTSSAENSDTKEKDLTVELKSAYQKLEKAQGQQEELDKIEESSATVKVVSGRMYSTGTFHQFGVLLKRTGQNMVRNPQSLIGNMVVNVLIGLAFGLLYYQVDDSPDKGVQNRLGVLFFISTNLLFGATLVIDNFIKEREIFIHEHVSGYYSVFAYFIAKVLADLIPLRTISPIIFCSITYWMVGFKADPGTFFVFLLTVVLAGYSAVGIGLFYSSTFQPPVGQLVMVLTFIFTIIFSGLLINVDSVMPWLSWLKYLSVARYSLVALSINEMRGRVFTSCNNITSLEMSSSFGSVPYSNMTKYDNGTVCVTVKGEEFLHTSLAIGTSAADITDWDMWQNHVALSCFVVGLFCLTYIQLTRVKTYS